MSFAPDLTEKNCLHRCNEYTVKTGQCSCHNRFKNMKSSYDLTINAIEATSIEPWKPSQEEQEETIARLKAMGYKHGVWIKADGVPPVQVGWGISYHPLHRWYVSGCMDAFGEYWTSVPIYKLDTDTYAQIIDQP